MLQRMSNYAVDDPHYAPYYANKSYKNVIKNFTEHARKHNQCLMYCNIMAINLSEFMTNTYLKPSHNT